MLPTNMTITILKKPAKIRDVIEKKTNTSRKTVLDNYNALLTIIVNNHALWKNQSRKEDACYFIDSD